MKPRWAVFISGQGSNLQVLLDLMPAVEIACVVSDQPLAYGLKRAESKGVKTWVLPKPFPWDDLAATLESFGVTHIFLLGFMRLVPASFLKTWNRPILNLHPSLLPEFKGLRAIEQSYLAQADMGVSIHHVTAELDAGPLILQRKVILSSEIKSGKLTLAQAEAQIHQVEHEMVKEVVLAWNQ